MKSEKYLNRFISLQQYKIGLTQRKSADYAGQENAFKNFQLIEVLTDGRISAAAGILVRMTDKLQRIANLLARPPQVVTESLDDACNDLAVYSDILYLWNTRNMPELVFPGQVAKAPTPEPLPEGYTDLPPDVSSNTLEETYDTLAAKVLSGRISELSPTERSYLELVTKMKMGIGQDNTAEAS